MTGASTRRHITTRAEDIDKFNRDRRNRNAIIFFGLLGLTFSIYGYCISRVKQDNFSDVDKDGNLRTKI